MRRHRGRVGLAALACLATVATGGLAVVAAGATAQEAAAPVSGERLNGMGRVETAVAASQALWEAAEVVVVATAADFPDALAAGALAANRGAPLLLTLPDTLPEVVAAEVERLASREVLVVGGRRAIADEVLEALRALDGAPAVRRVAGADRFATAAEVAALVRARGAGGDVLLASGLAFADAVAGGALLTRDATPAVLLATTAALPPASAAALDDLAPDRVLLLGGRAVLGRQVEDDVRREGRAVERLAGADRYATSVAVLDAALAGRAEPRPLIAVTGERFPDALAAGAVAARLDGVVLLVPQRRLTANLDAAVRRHADRFDRLVVLGGDQAVGNHVVAELEAAIAGDPRPGFVGTAEPLPAEVRERMTGTSWREGCPIHLDDLAYLRLRHWDLRGQARDGELVVAARVAEDVLRVFARLWEVGFPLAQVRLVDDFDADDDASMAANNTSAFNCRRVAGTQRWSEHAYGVAIDLNPVQNPYVRGELVEPPAGRAYLDRGDVRPGMVVRPGPVVDAFAAIGWGWGGDWTNAKDYQHFSASGR